MLDSPVDRADPELPPPASGGDPVAGPCERPFVGRAAELDELNVALDAAVAGEGRLFLISGEPGIGKTRLAWEFTRVARSRGALVCWGRCWEAGGAPSYWPWTEVIRLLMASPARPSANDLARAAPYLAQIVPGFAAELGIELHAIPPPTDPDGARFLLFDAVATFFRHVARATPLVVVLDDLHVADRASLLLLAFLSRALADERVMLVGTYRALEARALAELLEPLARIGRQARRQLLRGLTPDDVALLIEHATGARPSERVVSTIHNATEGNAFFIDEVLTLLSANGQLTTDGRLVTPIAVPDGVRDAIRLRLAPLSAASRAILAVAAVQGREFDVAIVSVASGVDHARVLEALSDALRAGLIVEPLGCSGRFLFRHVLIREVLYEELDLARRVELHHEIGKALQARPAVSGDAIAEIAHHFLAAAPLCGDVSVEHGTRAARRALEQMAFEAAVDLYQRTVDALTHASPNERRACALLIELGGAQEWAGDAQRSRATLEEAAAIARRIDATDLLVQAALAIGAVAALKFTAISRCDSAPDLLREALSKISSDDTDTRARLLSRLALSLCSHPDALELSERALAAARISGNPATLAQALTARHGVLLGPDHFDERCAIADEMLALAHRTGSREIALRGYALRITDTAETSDVASVDQALAAHGQLAQQANDPFEQWANLVWRSYRASSDGRFSEAEDLARRAWKFAELPGLHRHELYARTTFLGQMFFINETISEASIDPAVVEDYQYRFPEMAVWLAAPLRFATKSRDRFAVRRHLDRLTYGDVVHLPRTGTWLTAMIFIAEATYLLRDVSKAAWLYPLLLPYKNRNVTVSVVSSLGPMARPLGLLAATLSNWELADAHFEKAIAMCGRMDALPHLATCYHDYARTLLLRNDERFHQKALNLAQDGLAIASQLGMRPLIDEARETVRLLSLGTHDPSDDERPLFDHSGEIWTVRYNGEQVHLRNAKGLTYIAELVRQAGREVHVLDLLRLVAPDGSVSERAGASPGDARGWHECPADELIDLRARRAYRRRLTQITAAMEAAEASGDPETVISLREELVALQRELRRAVGLRGRPRTSSVVERARVSVTRAIRLAVMRATGASQELGEHLSSSIRTGTFCSYMPEPPRSSKLP